VKIHRRANESAPMAKA